MNKEQTKMTWVEDKNEEFTSSKYNELVNLFICLSLNGYVEVGVWGILQTGAKNNIK